MPTAVVLGVNGQDGTFLARHLVSRGYRVVGVGRQSVARHVAATTGFEYRSLDVRDGAAVADLLRGAAPDLIFHVAAVHTSAEGGLYEPVFRDMVQVNLGSLHSALEHLRVENPSARIVYAGSAKVFGEAYPRQIDEATPRSSTCLYSITKNAALDLIRHYRRHHRSAAGFLFLFNHESELRPSHFFIPKLVDRLHRARRGEPGRTAFGSLGFWCDWGSAEEYMGLAVDVAERAPGQDFVLATGRSVFARDLVETVFREYGLDPAEFVEDRGESRGSQAEPYRVDASRLRAAIGRAPCVSIEEVCGSMLRRLG